jgi:hypothetical protein
MMPEVDVVIGGEQHEADDGFDNVEYVLDAASLGIPKGVIMLGHVISEQTGMEDLGHWLRTLLHDVPIQFVARRRTVLVGQEIEGLGRIPERTRPLPIMNRILSAVLTRKEPRSSGNAGMSTADRIQ